MVAIWRGPIARNLGGAVGTQICLLISGTVAARLLGPQNRGYLAILTAWPSAVGQIGAVGMSLAATYYLSSGQIGGADLIGLLRRPATIQILALTAINASIILCYTAISGAPILLSACISLAQLPVAVFADYGFAFLLGTRRHGLVSAYRSLAPGLYAASLLALLITHRAALAATVVCLVASNVIAGVLVLASGLRAARTLSPGDSLISRIGRKRTRRQILAFGRKGYVGYLSPVDSFRIDQLVVGFLVSPRALGFYVVGSAFTNFTRLVAVNIGLSSTAEISAQASRADQLRAVRRMLILSGAILSAVTLVFSGLVVVAIPILFGHRYASAVPIAEILFAAAWILSMKRVAVDAMRGAGEAKVGTKAEIANFLLFLVLCGPLGLTLGGPGVATALVLASAGGSVVLIRRLRQLGVLSLAPRA